MPQPPADNKPNSGSAYLHIEGVAPYKWKWVKASQRARKPLAEWVIEALNQAAEEPDKPGDPAPRPE